MLMVQTFEIMSFMYSHSGNQSADDLVGDTEGNLCYMC
jgi:hypothetical protein